MARIPMGNFGNAMPQVERIQMPQRNTGQLAQAVGNLGQVFQNKAIDRRQKEDEADVSAKNAELYNNQMAEKEGKVKLDDVLTTELSEQITLLKNDVANGAMTADVANKNLQTWSQERFKGLENDLPMHARLDLQNYWSQNVAKNATSFLPLQLSADNKKGEVLADRYLEIGTRMDREAGAEYVKSNIQSLNIPEAQKQALIYKYQGARDLQDIDGRITSAIENKDTASLQQLVTEMDNGGFGYTDGPTLQQKKAQALSRIDAINKQVEVEENKRLQLAGKALTEFKSQVMTGRALDDDYLQTMGAAVQGTEYEAEYNFYKSQSTNFQSFGRLSTAEMEKRVNQQKAKMANSKTADAVTEEKVLGVYESILNEKKQTIKDNPNQAVREAGLQTHQLTGMELKTNPGGFAEKVVDNAVSQVALKDPNLVIKPIAAEDLPEAKQAFDAMGVNQKLDFIGNLIQQSKGVPSGNKIWSAALGQLGGGDLSYLMAGVARANNYRSRDGEDVAVAIVSGTQALKNKALVMPKDDLLKAEFNKYVGSTVSGATANMSFAAFKSIYAHLSERNGYQHKDKDDISKELTSTALSLATGGVYEQGVKYGNQKTWKVSKPYGMDDDRFESILDTRYAAIAQKYQTSEAELKDLRLRRESKNGPKGQIRYALINERGTPLFYMNMPDGVTK
ncbi:methyl-coenzyme M reductase [Acinetobacter sp. ASP199]|uniref:methyl-coenzyme M reductase n=1 Tax=unclassified Acinetobacter TaxID=196816 RepID=UPI001F60086C|nr:methyl-coenzyme M reductase [Acinetobacter sp. ASP199]UNT60468.1 methyl-coenzyme M reductase [Acinetobacter sp. ASP199]